MGCDIHIVAQKKTADGWVDLDISPFDCRNYGLFGWLANVRNYYDVPPLSEPRGLPDDLPYRDDNDYRFGDHSFSWLSVSELANFDMDQTMEDRRVTRQTGSNSWDGGCTSAPGAGQMMTYREFLGEWVIKEIQNLVDSGADRIVFGFDS